MHGSAADAGTVKSMATIAEGRVPARRSRAGTYPTSDGKPMAETDKHRDLMVYAIEALKARFADRPDV